MPKLAPNNSNNVAVSKVVNRQCESPPWAFPGKNKNDLNKNAFAIQFITRTSL